MSEPTIYIENDIATKDRLFTLRIPASWYIRVDFPKLKLWWWLTKMVWRLH